VVRQCHRFASLGLAAKGAKKTQPFITVKKARKVALPVGYLSVSETNKRRRKKRRDPWVRIHRTGHSVNAMQPFQKVFFFWIQWTVNRTAADVPGAPKISTWYSIPSGTAKKHKITGEKVTQILSAGRTIKNLAGHGFVTRWSCQNHDVCTRKKKRIFFGITILLLPQDNINLGLS